MKNTYLKMTAVALTACVGLAATTQKALAQPATDGDFGTLVDQGCATTWTTLNTSPTATGAFIRWLKFTIPAGSTITAGGALYLDLDTDGAGTTVSDTELGVYSSTGALINNDDDDGVGNHSALSFGNTIVRASLPAPEVAYNGRDTGTFAPGTYYVAVGAFNVTFNATAYSVTTTSTATGGVIGVRVRFGTAATAASGSPASFTGLGSLTADGNFVTTPVSFDATNQIRWISFTVGAVAAATRTYLDIDTEGSPALVGGLAATQLALYSSTGARLVLDTTDGTDTLSQISYGFATGRPAPGNGVAYNGRDGTTLAAGTYWVAVAPTASSLGTTNWATAYSACTAPTLGNAQVRIRTGTQPTPPAPTADLDLLTIPMTGSFTSGSVAVTAGGVKWVKLNLASPIDNLTRTYLDIDTETTPAPVTTTAIALYNGTNAALIASDTVDGSASLSQLTFGFPGGATTPASTQRAAIGTGLAYNGRDGVALAAGDYYLAVAAAPATFATDYGATSTGTQAGTVNVNVRAGTWPLPPLPTLQPGGDLGDIGACPTTFTGTLAANEVKWYKFNLLVNVPAGGVNYVDITTAGSILTGTSFANDTFIALYRSNATIAATDDDDGPGFTSLLSFGNTSAPRPAIGDGAPFDGRDGGLLAGTYYFAAAAYPVTYSPEFNAVSTSAANGTWVCKITYGDTSIVNSIPGTFTNLGTLPIDGSTTTGSTSITSPSTIKWFKFTTTGIAAASRQYLDLDTETSGLASAALGVYSVAGVVQASDSGSGSGNLSKVSFGLGTRAAVGDGTAYAGGADLAAGDYYVAVCAGPASFNPSFTVTACSSTLGAITLRARSGIQPINYPITFTDLGTLTLPGGSCPTVVSAGPIANAGAGAVSWFKVVLPAVSNGAGTFCDINTNGSTVAGGTSTDNVMALYDNAGTVIASDDQDGQDSNAALSFGLTTPTRANGTNGTAGDGRDGASLAGGTYWIGVMDWSSTATNFGFIAEYATTGQAGATDSQDRVQIILGNAPVITTGTPVTFTDLGTLVSDGNFNTQAFSLASGEIKWFKFTTAAVAAASREFLDIDTEGSTGVTATELALFDSTGALKVTDTTDGTDNLSQISYGFTLGRSAPGNGLGYNGRDGATLTAGDYWVAVAGSGATFSANWGYTSCDTQSGSAQLRIRTGTQPLPTAPSTDLDLGTLPNTGVFQTGTVTIASGGIKWAKFTLASDVAAATRTYLDIDTEGTLAPVTTTAIGLYNPTNAALIVSDTTDGTDSLSQISIGFTGGGRAAPGNGLAYNGRDGTGILAGTYYLAVAAAPATFAAEYTVSSTGTQAGDIKVNARTGVVAPPAPPATAIDLGLVRSIPDPDNIGQFLPGSKTTGLVPVTGSPVVWAKFSIRKPTLASGSPINYVDIHTIGSALPAVGTFGPNDTDMAIFYGPGLIGAGNVKDETDDFAGGTVTGRESLLSYGQTTPARTYNGSPNGTAAATGQNTVGLGAGTYYVAVTQWNGTFATEYSATGAATTGGSIQLTVISNQPPYCNAADVATTGSGVSGGPDGQNTVDDIIGFLSEFFANNLAVADLITLGGGLPAIPDGQITVDDLIYFLGQFFAPCIP